MIRLLALREVMKHTTAEPATALCCGNTAYIELMKLLPNVLPKQTWYDLVQAQLLSGIKPRHLNERLEEPIPKSKLYRIKHYPCFPDAEYINPEVSLDMYIPIAQQFYNNILKPLQLPDYIPIEDDYMMWYFIRSICRSSALSLIYVRDEKIMDMIRVMQAQPEGHAGYFLSKYGYDSAHTRAVGVRQQGAHNYTVIPDDAGERACKKYRAQLEEVYDLLYNIRCKGIVNDNLMEGRYADFF